MARFQLAIPPGVMAGGTEYMSKGRYNDAYCIRWYNGALGPVGGWRSRSANQPSGLARAAVAWKTNNATTYLGIGTHSNLYVSNRAGDLFDITPSGFTVGHANASGTGGYGQSTYGSGAYGIPRPDAALITDATMWTLDTWGQDLLGVSPDDRTLYEWVSTNTAVIAAKVTNSPACSAIVVTPERFAMALATDDPRTVSWSDQQNNTVWTPSTTNQAGSFPLQTPGRLMCGARVRGGTLLFTDVDTWIATNIGGVLVYGFVQVGDGCGIISRGACATFDQQAVWMSPNGFWIYNGYAQPLNCDVWDYIRTDINPIQVSKIHAVRYAASFEVKFYYCSSQSDEIDRCVVWQYKDNIWNIGRPPRTCGVDSGAFRYPVEIGTDGTIYDHEVGFGYDVAPYAESGPVEIGNGDNVVYVTRLYPDEKTSGQVTATFKLKFEPDADETAYGPYNLSAETDVRFVARQAKIRYTGDVLADWRVGIPRLEGQLGGLR